MNGWTENQFPREYVNKVICADSIEFMKKLPDQCIDVVLTDPVWPGTVVHGHLPGIENPELLWYKAIAQIIRLTKRLIVVLGCNCDPDFLNIPDKLKFLRCVWLSRIPPSPRDSILYDADIAYVFGHAKLNGSCRVMPGLSVGRVQDITVPFGDHPCPRNPNHMKYLVHHYSRPGSLIFDPFCGSGQILAAAKSLRRDYCGVDILKKYVELSESEILKIQPRLFDTDKSKFEPDYINNDLEL